MTNEITVEGVTYNVSGETTYTMEPGKLYQDSCLSSIVCLDFKGFTTSYSSRFGRWDVGNVCFPLRELTPVVEKQPELVDLECGYHYDLNRGQYRVAIKNLAAAVDRAIKSEKVVITMPDKSIAVYKQDIITPWTRSYEDGTAHGVSVTEVAKETEAAIVAGRRVQVEM